MNDTMTENRTLPVAIDYSLAQLSRPTTRVDWQLEPSRAVLLVHDMQEYFVRGYAPALRAELIGAIRRVLDAARTAGVPVVHTAQPGAQAACDRRLLTDFWGPGVPDDQRLTRLVEGIDPGPEETVLTKWRYSAFVRSDLAQRLRDLGRDQLVIVGVYAHIGCLTTAMDAFMHDVQPFVLADAVADFSAEHHRQALENVAGLCGVVGSVEQTCAAFAGNGSDRVPDSASDSAGETVIDLTADDPARPTELDPEQWRRWLRARVAELTEEPIERIDDDLDLSLIGVDSARLMALLTMLAEQGVEVDFGEFMFEPTLGRLHDLVAASRA